MITLNVNLKELNQLKAGMFKAVDNAIAKTLNQFGRELAQKIKADTPKGVSGNLKFGIFSRVIGQFLSI